MLQRVLVAIADAAGAVTIQSLASSLELSEPLVMEIVTQLETLGYLRRPEICVSHEGCSHCGLRAVCQTRGWHLWELTEKGTRAARAAK